MTRCRLAYIAEEKGKLFSLDSAQYAVLEGYRSTLLEQIADIDTLDQQREAGTSVDQAQYDTLVQHRTGTQVQYNEYMSNLDSLRQLRIQYLLQLNAGFSTSLTPDANHKTVNAILLDWLATDNIASSDMETLISIAGQCPLEGGDAVYEARALVSHLAGTEFDDRDLCGVQNRQSRKGKQELTNQIVIFPNPTTGELFLDVVTGGITARVFNLLGELKMDTPFAGNRLDMNALPDGIYTVQLLSIDGQLLANAKVLLIKG
mgnify:CR=1 FL=1